MPERLSEAQRVQIGMETTPGVAVPADILLTSASMMLTSDPNYDTFGPTGMMFNTISSLNTETAGGDLEGRATFTELVYFLTTLFGDAVITTPSGATLARQWEFVANPTGPNDPPSMTVERGDDNIAERSAGVRLVELGMTVGDDGAQLSGALLGLAVEPGITMTAAPTATPLVPVFRGMFSAYMDVPGANVAANDTAFGTTKLTRVREFTWGVGGKFSPFFALDAANGAGPATTIERKGEWEGELTLMRDATGMGLLTVARVGASRLLRVEAVGGLIEVGHNYSLTIDQAIKVTGGGDAEEDEGAEVTTYTYEPMYLESWEKAIRIRVVNTLTAL